MKIYIHSTFSKLNTDLTSYISTIKGTQLFFEKFNRYDQQFMLRMAKNPTRYWSSIDGSVWYTVYANREPE